MELKTASGDVEYLRPCINNEESGNMSAALVTDKGYSANMVKQLRTLLNDEKKIVQSKQSRKRRIVDVTFPSNWTGNLHKTQRVLLDRRSNEFKKGKCYRIAKSSWQTWSKY